MIRQLAVSELPQGADITRNAVAEGLQPLYWDLPLPAHIDQERVVIDMRKLQRMNRVGAFSAALVTEYIGEASEVHSVAGIHEDGSAIKGASQTTKEVETSKSDFFYIDDYSAQLHKTYGRPIVKHLVNRTELVQDVINLKDKGDTDIEAWAKTLDVVLRSSIREASKKHLVDRATTLEKLYHHSLTGMSGTISIVEASGGKPSLTLASYAGLYALVNGFEAMLVKKYRGVEMLKDRRWSIFINDVQTDRYVALNALSRAPSLVGVKK